MCPSIGIFYIECCISNSNQPLPPSDFLFCILNHLRVVVDSYISYISRAFWWVLPMRCLVQLLFVTLLVPSMYCSRLVLAAPRVSGWARRCVLNLAHSLQCTKWTIVRPSFSLVLIPKWSTKFWPHPLKVFNSPELPFPRDIFADTVPVMRNHAPVFTKLLLVNLRMIQGTVLSQLLLYIVPQLLINRDVQGMIVKLSTHNTVWPHLI